MRSLQSWRALRRHPRLSITTSLYPRSLVTARPQISHFNTQRAIIIASIACVATIAGIASYHRPLLDAPIEGSHVTTRSEQDKIEARYVEHMETLRASQMKGQIRTATDQIIRFHSVQHASNSPCEDDMAFGQKPAAAGLPWAFWAVYDGHAGGATSKLLKSTLIAEIAKDLKAVKSDADVDASIKGTFQRLDDQIIQRGLDALRSSSPVSEANKTLLDPAYAGSCALVAILDPTQSKLRVAVTGDSRAVLGHFSEDAGGYTAIPMSIDQNGLNPLEKERLDRNHPGEDKVINPRSGRVLGIAISRAFGDARWKWSEEDSLLANEKFGGPRMRGLGPPGSVKTPPYLIAEPEIREVDVAMGSQQRNADFLIMASDGFWDHISTEDAVTCVSEWVRAQAYNTKFKKSPAPPIKDSQDRRLAEAFGRPSPIEWPLKKGSGIWGDWQVKPDDFVYEEPNAATHLVQNAFGGRRRGLFVGAMSETYPLSRWARDDISVYVVFFGKVNGHSIVDEPEFRIV